MGSSADWTPFLDPMSGRADLVAVDLPGHGKSLNQPASAYGIGGAVQALRDVLDDAGIEECALVGYSMGGRVALSFTLQHPSRVNELVLESTSPGLKTEDERADRRRVDDRRAREIERDLDAFLASWYRQSLFASLDRHDLVEEMVDTRAENDPTELARALRGMSPGEQPSLWEWLHEVDVPTLLLTGALDEKYKRITRQTAEQMGAAERVVIPDAGHNVHAERPRIFLNHVLDFLSVG